MTKTETRQGDHTFINSGFADYLNRPICEKCSQVENHIRHGWPSTPDGARERDAAVLGERGQP